MQDNENTTERPERRTPPTTEDLLDQIREQRNRDAANSIRSLIDRDSGRIRNWGE